MTNEELVLAIQRGDDPEQNLERLWLQNQGLISSIVNRFSGLDDPDDLRQEAFIGMMYAVRAWEPDGGAKFATFATTAIKQAVKRYLDNNGTIRLPVYQHERIGKYLTAVEKLRQDLGREPTAAEVAARLDLKLSEVEKIQRDADRLQVSSLDAAIGEDIALGDAIADTRDDIGAIIDRVHAEELSKTLWRMVDDLPGREAAVIRGRYKDDQGLKELGADLGISLERVRQIEGEGLKRLRRRRRQLEPYLEDIALRSIGRSGLGAFKRTQTSGPEWAVLQLEKLKSD